MRGHPDEARLNDFVDGTLPPHEAAGVADHVARCDSCAADVAALGEILGAAQELPRTMEPERDLWRGIEARIGARAVVDLEEARGRVGRRRGSTSPWPGRIALAAAAGLLVVASSTATLLVVRARTVAPVAAAPAVDPAPPAGVHLVSEVEGGYAEAVDVLQSSLAERRGELRPETVAVIEENLRIIDGAIATASAALVNDPANLELARTLRFAYRQKVELLERAVKLQRI